MKRILFSVVLLVSANAVAMEKSFLYFDMERYTKEAVTDFLGEHWEALKEFAEDNNPKELYRFINYQIHFLVDYEYAKKAVERAADDKGLLPFLKQDRMKSFQLFKKDFVEDIRLLAQNKLKNEVPCVLLGYKKHRAKKAASQSSKKR